MAALDEAEAFDFRQLLRPRIGRAFFEPAQRSGAGAAEHDAAVPCLAKNHVDALRFPDRLLIQRVAARADDAVDGQKHFFPAAQLLRARDETVLLRRLAVERRAAPIPADAAIR